MSYLAVFCQGKQPYHRKLDGDVVIGRGLGCELWLDDGRLSRRHCRIERRGDQWVVVDLGSTNGTIIQGEAVTHHVLRDGDSFEVGDTRVVFHADERVVSPSRPLDPSSSQIQRALHETGTEHPAIDESLAARLPRVPSPTTSSPRPPRPHGRDQGRRDSQRTVPLPFARPPARPIVDEATAHKRWSISSLLTPFRRKKTNKPI